jgi:hypothetical protein
MEAAYRDRLWTAALVLIATFSLFALTSSDRFQGYEAETYAVSEGFVRTGHFQLMKDSPFTGGQGHRGKDGRLYGRTTIVQPLLAAPLTFVGYHLDDIAGSTKFRTFLLRYFSPLMAALAAAGIFLLVARYRPRRAAIAVSVLFAAASIAWPYARIGMETTFMALLVLALLSADWARRRPSVTSWGVTGLVGGAAMVSKPYAVLAVAPLALLLIPRVRRPLRAALPATVALLAPILCWGLLTLWYNYTRHGSITDFGSAERTSPTFAATFNFAGLLISPGKGLLLYSPLAILGLVGLRAMWRAERRLTVAAMLSFASLAGFIAVSSHWSEETWGPRYIVPVAWILLLPIAWWATTRTRRRVLVALAVPAVLVQLIAVVIPYSGYFHAAPSLSGVPLFQGRVSGVGGTDISDSDPRVPYGRDAMRWVPQMSPLLLQGELVTSIASEKLGGPALTIDYAPFEGRRTKTDLAGAEKRWRLPLPDFAWAGGTKFDMAFGLLMLIALALSGRTLWVRARMDGEPPDIDLGGADPAAREVVATR